MTERRTVPRVEPPGGVKAKVKTSLPAQIVDISSQGAQVEVSNSLRPRVPCDLRIQLDDGEVLLRATVRRCRAWGFGIDDLNRRVLLYRAGLEFDEVPPEVLARLSSSFLFPDTASSQTETLPRPEPPVAAAAAAPATPSGATRRSGPVRIRINSEHVRKILRRTGEE
jgi:hypothetical protein